MEKSNAHIEHTQQAVNQIKSYVDKLQQKPEYTTIDMSNIYDALDKMTDMTNMSKRDLLSKHTSIWQGKNGDWYTYLPDERRGRILKHRKTKETIEKVVIDYFKSTMKFPTVKEVFTEWLGKRMDREEIEKSTFTRYQNVFKSYFTAIQSRKIQTLTEMDIEDFVKDTIRQKNLSRKAFSNLRTLLYGIFRYAKKQGLVEFNIYTVVSEIEFSRKEFYQCKHEDIEQVFMLDEEAKMIEYLTANQDLINLGLLLLFKTGLRIGELCALQMSDLSDCKISVNKTETIFKEHNKVHYDIKETPKTQAGVRTVILPDSYKWILDNIRRLNPFGEYLFMENGERIRSYRFRTRLYTSCRKLGIVVKSPHKARKTYGTKLYDSDLPKSFMLQQMGHTEISCLEKHYYFNRMTDKQKEEAINKIVAI